MINVFYQKKKICSDCYEYLLEVKGHANYAPIGQDIVCAAVSSLIETYTSYSNNKPQIKGNGAFFMRLNCSEEDACLDMVIHGLKEISRSYPNHVTVITF